MKDISLPPFFEFGLRVVLRHGFSRRKRERESRERNFYIFFLKKQRPRERKKRVPFIKSSHKIRTYIKTRHARGEDPSFFTFVFWRIKREGERRSSLSLLSLCLYPHTRER
jgi:hypothetical protein